MISRGRELIEGFFAGDDSLVEEYRDDPKRLFEEMGLVRFSDKAGELFDAVYGDEFPHVVAEGPRGGGKSFVITLALGSRFMFKRDDVFQLAGSEQQAKNGFRYVAEFVTGETRLAEFLADDLKTAATTKWGNWYKIAACSQKAVRGPHAGDPHREMGNGNQAHGGVLFIDEEAEVPDEISDAARKIINTARPRKLVRSSTAHKTTGRFSQVIANPGRFGAKLIRFDIIDVTETCRHKCEACPAGRYFAGALFGGRPCRLRTPGIQPGAPELPFPTKASVEAWEAWKRDNNFPMEEEAICRGRAKTHRPGHVKLEDLFQEVRESQSRETDEVESFGRRRGSGANVLDGAALEKCLDPAAGWLPGFETFATADWGWNWTVWIIWQKQPGKVVPVEVYYLRHEAISAVKLMAKEWASRLRFFELYPDSSHKHENAEMEAAGFEVHPVSFAEWKDFGVRWLGDVIKRGELAFPGCVVEGNEREGVGQEGKYEFKSPGHKKLFEQMLGWRKDKNGKIVKRDDHGPDSALCAAVKCAVGNEWKVEVMGTGERESGSMGWQ